jgi:hypothetical protein
MGSSDHEKIPKLKGTSNYPVWSIRLTAYLTKYHELTTGGLIGRSPRRGTPRQLIIIQPIKEGLRLVEVSQ